MLCQRVYWRIPHLQQVFSMMGTSQPMPYQDICNAVQEWLCHPHQSLHRYPDSMLHFRDPLLCEICSNSGRRLLWSVKAKSPRSVTRGTTPTRPERNHANFNPRNISRLVLHLKAMTLILTRNFRSCLLRLSEGSEVSLNFSMKLCTHSDVGIPEKKKKSLRAKWCIYLFFPSFSKER